MIQPASMPNVSSRVGLDQSEPPPQLQNPAQLQTTTADVPSLRDLFASLPPPAHAFAQSRVGAMQSADSSALKTTSIPARARTVANYVISHNGQAPAGYVGGRTFTNDGSSNEMVLPRKDASGKAITYREYDVNPKVQGVNRGPERIVVGSDGSAWYTSDHYKTFAKIF